MFLFEIKYYYVLLPTIFGELHVITEIPILSRSEIFSVVARRAVSASPGTFRNADLRPHLRPAQ